MVWIGTFLKEITSRTADRNFWQKSVPGRWLKTTYTGNPIDRVRSQWFSIVAKKSWPEAPEGTLLFLKCRFLKDPPLYLPGSLVPSGGPINILIRCPGYGRCSDSFEALAARTSAQSATGVPARADSWGSCESAGAMAASRTVQWGEAVAIRDMSGLDFQKSRRMDWNDINGMSSNLFRHQCHEWPANIPLIEYTRFATQNLFTNVMNELVTGNYRSHDI
jgi:hypothetical protein